MGLSGLSGLRGLPSLCYGTRFQGENPGNNPTVLFEDSFEADAPETNPPTGWTIGEGSGFRVITAANEYDGSAGSFVGTDGVQLIEGVGSNTASIRIPVDISGHENSNLFFSCLANDGGALDTTLEAGDVLRIEYAFTANAQTTPGAWSIAIQAEANFAPDNAMIALDSTGTTINPGGLSTLWIQVWQDVDNAEAFVVDKVRVETV